MRKVKGSMMLEATIALVVISLCVAFSFSHISSMLSNDQSAIKVKSRQAVDHIFKTEEHKNASFSYEGFTIHQNILPYSNSSDVYLVEYEILDANDKTIEIIKHLKTNAED